MTFEQLLALAILVIALFFLSLLSRSKEKAVRDELRIGRSESAQAATELRKEVGFTLKGIEGIKSNINDQLDKIRTENEKKLEEIRKTVDEKLQGTLEKRLGESFKQVSDRLEAVHKGLGEMKNLASGVGDLKNVLTNVKVRGTWAEHQLEAQLAQILTPDQYDSNVATKTGSDERVEFAIRMPGSSSNRNPYIWLPIDSKFPQEDYLRLQDASEKADTEAIKNATKQLLQTIKTSAKTISGKYVDPPNTTDFAVMYLPTEGLYAEVLRHPGVLDELQTKHRITIAGPATMGAILNSLRLGFRTLAIEKRSSEVWQVLAAVKKEFGLFGAVLDKVQKKLSEASSQIDKSQMRSRAMERELKDVEQLPSTKVDSLLSLPERNKPIDD